MDEKTIDENINYWEEELKKHLINKETDFKKLDDFVTNIIVDSLKTEFSFYYIMSRFCREFKVYKISSIEFGRKIFGYKYQTDAKKNGSPSEILLEFMPNYEEKLGVKETKREYKKVSSLKKGLIIKLIFTIFILKNFISII